MNSDDERIAFWRRQWAAWPSSGLGQRAYCQQQGLSFSAFRYWRNRVKEELAVPTPAFVPVVVEPPAEARVPVMASVPSSPGRGAGIEIRLARGRTVVVAPEFDEALLARVIRVLEQ